MSKVLVISPTPTHPRGAGNRARVETMLTNLIHAGHEVSFLHIEQEEGDRAAMAEFWGDRYSFAEYGPVESMSSRLRKRWSRLTRPPGVHDYRIDDWYDDAVDEKIAQLHAKHTFDAVIVEYVFMSKALLQFDANVLKLIDTHDMFTDRHQRYIDEGQEPQWFSTTSAQEGKAFARADFVIAITDKEREAFSAMSATPVITVGHFVNLVNRDPAQVQPHSMLFVASDNPINLHGIEWFRDEALTLIREQYPEAEVQVVGTVAQQLQSQPGLKPLGRVDDLDEVYAKAHVVINPVRFNTGLSIKNLEALAYGCPLVTAPVGTEGLEEGEGYSYLVADEAEEWRNAIDRVFGGDGFTQELSTRAADAALAWNNNAMQELNRALSART